LDLPVVPPQRPADRARGGRRLLADAARRARAPLSPSSGVVGYCGPARDHPARACAVGGGRADRPLAPQPTAVRLSSGIVRSLRLVGDGKAGQLRGRESASVTALAAGRATAGSG